MKSLYKEFSVLCDISFLLFLGALMAFGPDNHKVFIPFEVFFLLVFSIRFIIMKSRFTTFTFWSIGFIFLSFCSVFYAPNRSLALARSISVVQVMLFANLIIPYMLESKRNYLFSLKGIVLGACFIIIHLCLVTNFQDFLTKRLGETIGINSNVVGYGLAISGLIALFLFLDSRKWYFVALSVLLCSLSLFSGSRKVVAILAIGITLLIILSQKTFLHSFIAFCLLFCLSLLTLYISFHWDPLYRILGSRVSSFLAFFTGGNSDGSTLIRMEMIQHGWEMVKQKPLFGWGQGAFTSIGGYGFYAHNNYIELMVSLGVVGTLWYYSLPFIILGKGMKAFFSTERQGAGILSITFMVIMLIDNVGRVMFNDELSTIVLALCYVGIVRKNPKARKTFELVSRKTKEWVKSPNLIVLHMLKWKIARLLPDKAFVSIKYRMSLKKKLDLENPKTYNEKLQWLKLYDRKEMYTKLVDKYEVREHIANTIGPEYLVPLIGVYDRVEDIDYDLLPAAFVLKPTHTSGDVIICRDKTTFDWEASKHEMHSWMEKNYYWYDREWPYKDVKARIVCEQLIETSDEKPPKDYKIFCFDGIPRLAFVASDRGKTTKFDYFDVDWNRMPLRQHYPNSTYEIPKPKQWDKMLFLAKVLSSGLSHVRVDFYIDMNENILFGELTFFHFSGFVEFEPDSYDLLLGNWLNLPEKFD